MKNLIIFLSLIAAIAVGCTKPANDGPLKVGMTYQGGVIFELPSNGQPGLMYAKDTGSGLTYAAAVTYCSNYSAGEHKDWRLPTCDEMTKMWNENLIHGLQYWIQDQNEFNSGSCEHQPAGMIFYVRPVRSF